MDTIESKITSKGQITIPSKVRQKLGLKPGSRIQWQAVGEKFIVTRASNYSSQDIHDAIFKSPPKSKTTADMDKGIASLMEKKHAGH